MYSTIYGVLIKIVTTYVVRLKLFRLNQASLPATPRQKAEGVIGDRLPYFGGM